MMQRAPQRLIRPAIRNLSTRSRQNWPDSQQVLDSSHTAPSSSSEPLPPSPAATSALPFDFSDYDAGTVTGAARKSEAASYGTQACKGKVKLPAELTEIIQRHIDESDKQKLRTDALDLFAHLRSTSSSSNQRAGNNRTGSSGRDPRPKNTLPPYNTEVTLAYAAALLPTLYAATVHVLSEAAKRLGPAGFRPSTVLDFGSGLSSAAWAAQNAWPESLQRYIGFDEAKPMHWLASDLLPPLDVSTKLHRLDFLDADILSYVPRQFASQSVALAAYTLSEITHPKKRAKLVQRLWDTGAEVVVLIDRGTPSGFSYIAQARAQLLELASKADAQGGHVVAPCPHDKACPLRFSKDFCHFAQRLERPGFLRATKHSSRGDEDASFSYVVFQRSPRPSPTTATSHSASGTKGGPLDRPTDMRTELVEGLPEQGTRQFDVLPLDPGPLSHTGETATEAMQLESSTWPRLVAPPLKRSGHIILDACAASGKIERFTIPKSQGKQAYADARKARWGDLFPHASKHGAHVRQRGVRRLEPLPVDESELGDWDIGEEGEQK